MRGRFWPDTAGHSTVAVRPYSVHSYAINGIGQGRIRLKATDTVPPLSFWVISGALLFMSTFLPATQRHATALSHRDHALSFWMNVARAEPGDWTCWLSLAHIPMRSQTTDPGELVDQLVQISFDKRRGLGLTGIPNIDRAAARR